MSPASVRPLADVRLTDAAEVGGKAASLGELLASGVRVPDGVVLTAGVSDETADDRRQLLETAARDLGPGPFAVRSSGVSEDGVDRSLAGIYESVLGVSAAGLGAATDHVLASARGVRVANYGAAGNGHMAVIVQHMVEPAAAGVILTADPVNGDRSTCIVTAVRGVGERLVGGSAFGDEWAVRGDVATARRRPEQAVSRKQVVELARQARQIAAARGMPQDVEWAIDTHGVVWIVQARPMTALPPDVSWASPARGAYTRQLRFGEWISEPVTPLFESWLLSDMEVRIHAYYMHWLGQRAPLPHHVIVNGWYFYSLNWFAPGSMLRSLPGILVHIARNPRVAAGVFPPTVRHAIPLSEREWREDIRPRYRAAVASAEARVETVPVDALPDLIDELVDLAGLSFASVTALSGAAYKMEINLARFYRTHLAKALGGSHLSLARRI